MSSVAVRGTLSRALDHGADVFGLALQLTGDRVRAEDLSQETYLRLVRSPGTDVDERPVRPLLFTITRNLFRNEARRRRPAPLDGVDDALDRARDPADEAEAREDAAVLRLALMELEPRWRAMLYLRDGLGFSHRDIAAALDASEDAVRTTLHRARLRLHERMTRHEKGGTRCPRATPPRSSSACDWTTSWMVRRLIVSPPTSRVVRPVGSWSTA